MANRWRQRSSQDGKVSGLTRRCTGGLPSVAPGELVRYAAILEHCMRKTYAIHSN